MDTPETQGATETEPSAGARAAAEAINIAWRWDIPLEEVARIIDREMAASVAEAKAALYLKIVEWSDEDKCFVGRVPSLFHGGVHGDNKAKVYAELCQAAEEWIETIERDGKPLPKPAAVEVITIQRERDLAFDYIRSLWRNNQLPAPMCEELREALVAK